MKPINYIALSVGVLLLVITSAFAQRSDRVLKPDATVDLRTLQGVKLTKGQWRYSDAQIVEVAHRAPGADLKPSGPPNQTHDITPHADSADFDDSQWEVVAPTALEQRRSTGKLSFAWYRINITIPEHVGSFNTDGSTVYFEIVVDDYAEVWINGKLPQVLGSTGGQLIKGWNAPNRVLVGKNVCPGQQIQLAIFGANGPLSQPPGNFIWIRSAALDFYSGDRASPVLQRTATDVERLDSAIDAIVPKDARIEKLADGFGFTEGPIWVAQPDPQNSYLLFSDPNNNTIYRYARDGDVSVFRTHSGYSGADIGEYGQPGSNGLTLDREGRLTICEHGNRRITRLEKNGTITVLADNYQGKRLNSPNDLVYRSDGALYFTDPPFGLPMFFNDKRKELNFSGVFCLKDGQLKLVSKDLSGPNGLAFSPDEKYLYVDNWDEKRKVIMRYEVSQDGILARGTVFFDATNIKGEQAWDGLKVDSAGNIYASGPGGILIVSAAGKHLGTIRPPVPPANFAWGDADGKTLYMTARTGLYRIRLSVAGIGSPASSIVSRSQ